MEKLLYVLWKKGDEPVADFNARLLGPLREKLAGMKAHRLQINVEDEHVAAGEPLRQGNMRPRPNAIVSFWLNSSHIRGSYEAAVADAAGRIAGYAVTESTVLPIDETVPDGTRTQGFAQFALIGRPPRLTHDAFMDIWQKSHTRVGVDTQSNFYYCQNIVNRTLTWDAPAWAAIVEECFPIEALTDPQAFYDAVGNAPKYEAHLKEMMDSCNRFIDFDRIDVIVTSKYRFGGWSDLAGQPAFPKRA